MGGTHEVVERPHRYIAADTELIPREAFQGTILALRSTLQRECSYIRGWLCKK